MKPIIKQDNIKIFESLGAQTVLISKIVQQKKNTGRYSIFIENNFLMGISEKTLTHFNLNVGSTINIEILKAIDSYEHQWNIKEYFIRLLARRDHSRQELQQKAVKKGYRKKDFEEVLDELVEKKYIKNDVFAKKFAHDKFHFNHWGKQKIKMELIKKGITSPEIETALEALSYNEQLEKMEYLVLKSKAKFLRAEKSKRRKKIFDFLVRKGYDSAQVMKVLPSLLSKLEE